MGVPCFYLRASLKKTNTRTKLIEEFVATDASVNDSQAMGQLLTDKDEVQSLYADSAYTVEELKAFYKKKKASTK